MADEDGSSKPTNQSSINLDTTLKSNEEAPPTSHTPSFAEAVAKASCIHNRIKDPAKHIVQKEGFPSVRFKISEKKQMLEHMEFVLIGKSSHERPSIHVIKPVVSIMPLKGRVHVSLFDDKHLFFECEKLEDYNFLWIERLWFIKSFPMRMFTWTHDFHPSRESPIMQMWIVLPGLPLYLYKEKHIFEVASAIGRPLTLDLLTHNRTKLGEARVCVEIDTSKPLKKLTWVSFEEDESDEEVEGFWKPKQYEEQPSFCDFCFHMGHRSEQCLKQQWLLKGKAVAIENEQHQVTILQRSTVVQQNPRRIESIIIKYVENTTRQEIVQSVVKERDGTSSTDPQGSTFKDARADFRAQTWHQTDVRTTKLRVVKHKTVKGNDKNQGGNCKKKNSDGGNKVKTTNRAVAASSTTLTNAEVSKFSVDQLGTELVSSSIRQPVTEHVKEGVNKLDFVSGSKATSSRLAGNKAGM